MNDAELYENNNLLQMRDAKRILSEYGKRLQWRRDGCDKLLDVGCGSGNVLMQLIRPILPINFEEILGTDKSTEMINFASERYKNIEGCNFRVLDLQTSQLPNELHEQFDHITSFYSLHWMKEQKKALENIYKMLRQDGGECLFTVLVRAPAFDIYPIMHNSTKWGSHMQDLAVHMASLYYSMDPVGEFTDMLHEVGFVNCKVEFEKSVFTYKGVQALKDNMKAVSPFMSRFSKEKQEEFMNDFAQVADNLGLFQWNSNMSDKNCIFPYQFMIVYAQKPYKTT